MCAACTQSVRVFPHRRFRGRREIVPVRNHQPSAEESHWSRLHWAPRNVRPGVACLGSVTVHRALRSRNFLRIAAIETSVHAVDLFDWKPRFPVCLIFGHEVDGIRPEIAARCDTHVRIPMLGIKHSLNVATAGGVAIYELLRKYRELCSQACGCAK